MDKCNFLREYDKIDYNYLAFNKSLNESTDLIRFDDLHLCSLLFKISMA